MVESERVVISEKEVEGSAPAFVAPHHKIPQLNDNPLRPYIIPHKLRERGPVLHRTRRPEPPFLDLDLVYICILNEITSVSHRPCNAISSLNPHDLLEYSCHRDLYSGKAPDMHPAKPTL